MDWCCSPMGRTVGKVAAVISSLAAIDSGAHVFGYDLLGMLKLHAYDRIIGYVFIAAGIISLLLLVLRCAESFSRHY